MDPAKFLSWMDTVIGIIVGVVSGVITTMVGMLGWFNRKLGKIEQELNEEIDVLKAASTACLIAQAEQKKMHEANLEQFREVKAGLGQLIKFQLERKR